MNFYVIDKPCVGISRGPSKFENKVIHAEYCSRRELKYLKARLKHLLLDSRMAQLSTPVIRKLRNFNSKTYWQKRYERGGNSGSGSQGSLRIFKAETLNEFVKAELISSVLELGCGDGRQLLLAEYPRYVGLDVSRTAITICEGLFAQDSSKSFFLVQDYPDEPSELVVSLDVIFHLIEDATYEQYMRNLFSSSSKFVVIYSTNFEEKRSGSIAHVRHRKFTSWVSTNRPDFSLKK